MKVVDIVGVPLDLGAGRRGVDMGPSGFRIADVGPRIRGLGYEVCDCGNIPVPIPEVIGVRDSHARYAREIGEVCESLCVRVRDSLASGHIPLSLGGAHSLPAGRFAGTAPGLRDKGRPFGRLWIAPLAEMITPE